MTVHRLISVAAASFLAFAASDRARADTLIDVGNGDSAIGTFFPATENEVYRFTVPSGAKLSVAALGKKQRGAPTPVARLVLRDPSFKDLTAAPGVLTPLPAGGKVSSLTIVKSGPYRATLTGDRSGDYAFSVKWKSPPQPPKAALTFAAQDETQTVAFAADAGTKATFTVAAATGSPSLPRLVRVAMKDGSWVSPPFAAAANATAPSHTVRNVVLGGAGGDYVLTVSESSAAPGAAAATLKLTPPKVKPRKVNLTSKQTGASPVNNAAKGGVVGPAGGSVEVSDPFDPTPIDGAGVEIPSGALPNPVVIVLSTANSLQPGGGTQSQGPAVNFGPDGLKFNQAQGGQVLVTIPFDPDAFGGDFAALDVYVRDSKGKVTLVQPKSSYVIDANAGTVTFPVSHFSSYQAFGPSRPSKADLNADGFDDLVVPAFHANGDVGKVLVFFGRADFATSPPTGPDLTLTGPQGDVGFGFDVAVGDVNGDGIADVAVSSYDPQAGDAGRVNVYFGGPSFAPAASDAHVDGAGIAPNTFGDRLLIGDLTGDGKGDLIVGAPGAATSPILAAEGVVYVFPGGASFATTTSDDAAAIVIHGGTAKFGLGRSLAIGRVVGDANADLVAGASPPDQLGAPGPGSVSIVPGGAGLASAAVAGAFVTYVGDAPQDGFGDSVTVADVNADGKDDLIVGAPGVDVRSGAVLADAGQVYAFFGPSLPGGAASQGAVLPQAFPTAGERRGFAVVTGNFAGSAVRDLAFSTPLRDSPQAVPDVGGLWIHAGGSGFPTGLSFTTPGQQDQHLGTRILQPADLDGDGRDDLAATSPGRDGGAGQVEVYFGQGIQTPMFQFTGNQGDRLGDR